MAKTKMVEEVQVASYAGTSASDKYLVANLKNVKETFVGRGQSVEHNADLPNGTLVFLGDLKEHETHIFKASTSGKAALTNLPFVMFRPEIIAREYSRMDKQLGIFRMKANKPHPAWQLNLLDKIEYSKDFFADEPALGDIYELAYGTTFGSKNNGFSDGICFKVVEVKNAWEPVAYSGKYELMPTSHKMYTLQLINKTA